MENDFLIDTAELRECADKLDRAADRATELKDAKRHLVAWARPPSWSPSFEMNLEAPNNVGATEAAAFVETWLKANWPELYPQIIAALDAETAAILHDVGPFMIARDDSEIDAGPDDSDGYEG